MTPLHLGLLVSISVHGALLFLMRAEPLIGRSESPLLLNVEIQNAGPSGPPSDRRFLAPMKKTAAPQGSDDGGDAETPIPGVSLGVRVIYPRISRELGEEGVVEVLIRRSDDGTMTSQIKEPRSSFERLNQAALRAVEGAIARGQLDTHFERRTQLALSFIFRLKN